MKKVQVCTSCGSPNVSVDASFHLNTKEVDLHDQCYCRNCDGGCKVEEVEVEDDFDARTDFYLENVYVSKLESLWDTVSKMVECGWLDQYRGHVGYEDLVNAMVELNCINAKIARV
ncbi:MAG: hypothetical protein FWF12_00085 [Betaproteobacteria bacterium]|nr:hypothetical protein [Betaproteobacteria bacterium]